LDRLKGFIGQSSRQRSTGFQPVYQSTFPITGQRPVPHLICPRNTASSSNTPMNRVTRRTSNAICVMAATTRSSRRSLLQPKDLPNGRKLSGPEQIRQGVMASGLRGRGGAGFSCGLKWSFVDRKSGKPIYLICNADESEPGTFKDRQIIYKDPHQLLEGMIISCFANDVHLAYIYIRGEFVEGAKILDRALTEAKAKNVLGNNILGAGYDLEIYVHRGAGAYICGEETGLIESLEGKRPYPRIKPPYFPAVLGLWMCRPSSTSRDALQREAHRHPGRHGIRQARHAQQHRHPHRQPQRPCEEAGLLRNRGRQVTIGELIFDANFGGRSPGRTEIEGGHPRRVVGQGFQGGRKIPNQGPGSGHARFAL